MDGFVIDRLRATLGDRLTTPDDPGYHDARQTFNATIQRRPAAIVRARSDDDVVTAVVAAGDLGLPIAVRGGGHSVAGHAMADGALVVDMRDLRAVRVDPLTRIVRAQAGALWEDVDGAAWAHHLAVVGGTFGDTGVAGLVLGGGIGWLSGLAGFTCDNLLRAELVTAAGERVVAGPDGDPDLLWALRGGGGNFGIATTFTYRLQPLEMVTGGLIAHPVDAAPELLRFYRDAVAGGSDDLTVFAGLVHAPDGSGAKLSALVVFHTGDAEQAEHDLEPFKTWGSPLVVEIGRMPYAVMNTLLDAGYPAGSLNYWLSSFTRGLPDGLIDTMVERFASVPSPMSAILLEHFHGAVTRVGVTDTAVPHRAEGWNLLLPSVWMDPAATDENIAWTRETHRAFGPHLEEARWLNYLGDDQDGDAVRAAYGPNYARLLELKRRYDPENVFHHNHNIVPS
jgi:FAD/FMN-containing dehydrogenase